MPEMYYINRATVNAIGKRSIVGAVGESCLIVWWIFGRLSHHLIPSLIYCFGCFMSDNSLVAQDTA